MEIVLTDRVKKPEEGEDRSGNRVRLLVFGTDDAGRCPRGVDQDPPDVEEGEVAEGVELGGDQQKTLKITKQVEHTPHLSKSRASVIAANGF